MLASVSGFPRYLFRPVFFFFLRGQPELSPDQLSTRLLFVSGWSLDTFSCVRKLFSIVFPFQNLSSFPTHVTQSSRFTPVPSRYFPSTGVTAGILQPWTQFICSLSRGRFWNHFLLLGTSHVLFFLVSFRKAFRLSGGFGPFFPSPLWPI